MASLAFDPLAVSMLLPADGKAKLRLEAPEFVPGSLCSCKEEGTLTAETLASTAMLSASPSAAEDDEECQDVRSRTSSEDLLEASQFSLQDLEGVWLGQGAHYGNLYTVKAEGATWHCHRSGLAGAKACRLSWDASNSRMVLAGRYTMDPASMTDQDCVVWTRIPGRGDGSKEVVWKRHVRRAPSIEAERCQAKVQEELQHRDVFSRDFLLFARHHGSDTPCPKMGITVKASSDVQFVCPANASAREQGKPAKGKPAKGQKSASKKTSQSIQRPAVKPMQLKTSMACLVSPAAALNVAEATADMVLEWLSVSSGPKRKAAQAEESLLPWDPCGMGKEATLPATSERPTALAVALAKKVAASPASLQADALRFLPCERTTKLRYEAPEFVPGATPAF